MKVTPTPAPQIASAGLDPKSKGVQKVIARWGDWAVDSYVALVNSESGFNPYSKNVSSGACGMYQALPCSKLPCPLADVDCQHNWGLAYISNRYGDPVKAWNFHIANGWY